MRSHQYALGIVPIVALLVATAFPAPQGYVSDFAGLLDPGAKQRLEARLATYQRETSNEIAIALLPSLEGRSINDVAVALFEQWKIGKRGANNGILIVVGRNERQVRIEVGYGLEGKVTDAQAGRIIRETIAPSFRQGNYAEGLERAVDELIALIGSPTSTARPRAPAPRRPDVGWLIFGLFAAGGLLLSALAQRTTQRRCPRCGTVLQRDTRAGLASRSVVYVCPKCGYQEHVIGSTPRGGVFPIFLGGSGWGSGGWSGGGGFSGFGGGSSGGGGASGGW